MEGDRWQWLVHNSPQPFPPLVTHLFLGAWNTFFGIPYPGRTLEPLTTPGTTQGISMARLSIRLDSLPNLTKTEDSSETHCLLLSLESFRRDSGSDGIWKAFSPRLCGLSSLAFLNHKSELPSPRLMKEGEMGIRNRIWGGDALIKTQSGINKMAVYFSLTSHPDVSIWLSRWLSFSKWLGAQVPSLF